MREIWKGIRDFPYEASNLGRMRRSVTTKGTRAGKVLRPWVGSTGYQSIVLRDRDRGLSAYVHVLVAECFLGPRPEKHDVNHKNGDKSDNRVSNLEYMTRQQNLLHAIRTGLRARGEDRPDSKLTTSDVRAIRRLCARKTLSQEKIGQQFGVSQSIISDIHRGLRWSHVN